jgi:hypothetical protein
MLCLDTHQDFDGVRWQDNPYNVVNGGACSKPSEWFTSEIARKQYRKRLRYIVARWGHAKSLLCWEFGNEFEGWPDSAEDIVISWHRKMAPVLKALDPYDHLVSTSWWTHMGPESCWRLPEIDIVQTHCYTNNDFNVAEPVKNYTNAQWLYYDKPHMFSEFGVDSRGPPLTTDSLGWSLHNAMWASVSSGGASTAMPWWHSSYIDPLNLYERFKFVASSMICRLVLQRGSHCQTLMLNSSKRKCLTRTWSYCLLLSGGARRCRTLLFTKAALSPTNRRSPNTCTVAITSPCATRRDLALIMPIGDV